MSSAVTQRLAAVSDQGLCFRKGIKMKSAMATTFVAALALVAAVGCMSPKGGGMSEDKGFKIQVPVFSPDIKQGDRLTINLSLQRGDFFKQDVKLLFKASDGISVTPTSALVKASDAKDVQLQIAAPKTAALGEYRVYVTGTPQTGQATSIEIKVKVVAP
jgi:hypothetical protein